MRARTLGFSLLVHATAMAAILIAPLLASPGRLPVPTRSLVLVRATHVPVPHVAPPAARSRDTPSPSTAPVAPEPAPTVEPASIAPPLFAPERIAAPLLGLAGTTDGAGFEPQAPPGPAAAATGPHRVGGLVEPPRRIRDVRPEYPPIARAAGIAGIVILDAVIDETGVVRDVRVLRPVPLLDEAAVTAVRQWRFAPTTLNGEPIPVVMTVTVRFDLR